MSVHDFASELAYSEQASEEDFWMKVYAKAFPSLSGQISNPNNNEAQRRGIDRVLLLNNGRVLCIDEKKRREVWNDILLEYISADTTRSPGWIEKDLAIDYLAYAFMPTQRCYLYDWLMLRRAWLHFGGQWKKEYRHVQARNQGYTTHAVAVPIPVLRNAVSKAGVIDVRLCGATKSEG